MAAAAAAAARRQETAAEALREELTRLAPAAMARRLEDRTIFMASMAAALAARETSVIMEPIIRQALEVVPQRVRIISRRSALAVRPPAAHCLPLQ
jgi:hypothetical protein